MENFARHIFSGLNRDLFKIDDFIFFYIKNAKEY